MKKYDILVAGGGFAGIGAAAAAAKHRWKQVYTAQPDKGGARVV